MSEMSKHRADMAQQTAEQRTARARMALYLAARDVLGAALRLLSIKPLERM